MFKRNKAFGILDLNMPLDGAVDFTLPLPTSVNRMLARLGNSSPKVQRWWRQADAHLLAHHRGITNHPVRGPFVLDVVWDYAEFGHTDIDNRVKPLLDYLQRVEMFENDRRCREMHVIFGDEAPNDGCRVRLRPWEWSD